MEGFDVLMRVAVDHPIDKRVFAPFDLDILGWLVRPIGQANVERDIVESLVQDEPLGWWESVIFPSKPRVSILPCVG